MSKIEIIDEAKTLEVEEEIFEIKDVSTKNHEEPTLEIEENTEPPVITEKKLVRGIVVNCFSLNVRKRPRTDPNNVITVIPVSTEVEIDLEKSNDEFYKVYTSAGIEGYCMKKFIAIRQ